jgi:hypothetical protein
MTSKRTTAPVVETGAAAVDSLLGSRSEFKLSHSTLPPQGLIARSRADYARYCADLALNDPANAAKYHAWVRGWMRGAK